MGRTLQKLVEWAAVFLGAASGYMSVAAFSRGLPELGVKFLMVVFAITAGLTALTCACASQRTPPKLAATCAFLSLFFFAGGVTVFYSTTVLFDLAALQNLDAGK